MNRCQIPVCYFPSSILFVDDSRDFLINFSLQLDDLLAYQLYDSPYEALRAVKAPHQSNQLNQRCLTEQFEFLGSPLTNQTINLDLSAIHWEVYNPLRFSEISVAVVDYVMPGMHGLDFCKNLVNSPIKKILLTGRADEKIAIEAFNQGLIDCYLQKNNPNIGQLINENIAHLQESYFQQMSDLIVKMLSVNNPSCLLDKKFAEFFEKFRKEHKIIEYYIIENSGSFLLLDFYGTPYNLIVKNKEDLQQCYELAVDNKAPQDVVEKLKTGHSIPYFAHSCDPYLKGWTDWGTYLHEATRLDCETTYYYALIKDPLAIDIQKDKILSYQEFLKQRDQLDILKDGK